MDERKAAYAREAHHRGIRQAIEIDAPTLPYEYAPQHLRTYANRTNIFKAPNSHLPRFHLPGRDKVVYPDDDITPNPPRALKRDFSQHQADSLQPAGPIVYRDGSLNKAHRSANLVVPFARLGIRPRTAFNKKHDGPRPDFRALCQPLTLQVEQLVEPPPPQQQQQQQQELPQHTELETSPSSAHQFLLPDEQAVQQARDSNHMQPQSSLAERGMSLFYGIFGYAGSAIRQLSPRNLFRNQQPRLGAAGVSLTSNGEEIPCKDEAQAPKRRRIVGEAGPDVAPVAREDVEMTDSQAETNGESDWPVGYRPSNGVASGSADAATATDSDPMVLVKDQIQAVSDRAVALKSRPSLPAEPTKSPKLHPISRAQQARDAYRTTKPSAVGYNESPEEWKNDVEVTKQVIEESFQANYDHERKLLETEKHDILTIEEVEEVHGKACAALTQRRASSSRAQPRYKNPRDFFDHERDHSIPTVPSTLSPNPRRIKEDIEAREAREEKKRQEEARRKREQADAQLKVLGLRTPLVAPIGPLSSVWSSKLDAAQGARFTPVKTCGPEVLDFGPKDFEQLIPPETWLNDQCISAAIQHAADWINKSAGVTIKKDTPKCVTLNTFFWKNLKEAGPNGKERMLKRVWGLTPQNFLDVESIIIPVNASAHWTFALIRPQRREIAYVDSFHSKQTDRIRTILEFVAVFLKEAYIAEEWEVVSFDTPRQTNSTDCGVFLITNAILLALGLDPSAYKAKDLSLQRRRIAAMILNGGFHGEFDLGKL